MVSSGQTYQQNEVIVQDNQLPRGENRQDGNPFAGAIQTTRRFDNGNPFKPNRTLDNPDTFQQRLFIPPQELSSNGFGAIEIGPGFGIGSPFNKPGSRSFLGFMDKPSQNPDPSEGLFQETVVSNNRGRALSNRQTDVRQITPYKNPYGNRLLVSL